jgi:hypothetical protein
MRQAVKAAIIKDMSLFEWYHIKCVYKLIVKSIKQIASRFRCFEVYILFLRRFLGIIRFN